MSYYIHHISGRIRLKTPVLKKNPEKKETLISLFGCAAGINGVSVNTLQAALSFIMILRSTPKKQ